ncbi:MAG: hypothetical protein JSU70_00895 [Phycisphaerales bacterium]|nr:MAG: hypothetical protein JSU70_00895 [Phycisphaerales bacterium]
MMTGRNWTVAIVLGLWLSAGLRSASVSQPNDKQKSLRAIAGVAVIARCGKEAREAGLKQEDIEKEVGARLQKAGVKVVHEFDRREIAGRPYLEIEVKAYKIPGQDMLVDNVDILLKQETSLIRNPEEKINAITWRLGWLSHASPSRFAKHIQENIRIMIDEFLRDYLAVNKTVEDPATDANDVASPTQGQQADSDVRASVVEYKYVASKNSAVFHKPDCRWAKRISAGNLVGYKSRGEATSSGKRPCKTCKP